ncbi:uncharacterized protein L201_001792 [Kwoniella dendrophila CBS 6074]|uniref:DUF7721 domain-containing protein n=1 Tax=Kwoniella dendrophila CBS 6074 TaxID=1295534 RepID=A0AAX4JPV6_9TREE
MDFLKKMATEKLNEMGNDNNNNGQQQQGQGQYQQGGYGGQQQGEYNNQQSSYGGGAPGGYDNEQSNYGDQQSCGNTGGEQYNRPHGQGGASSGFGGFGGAPTINENTALNAANEHASNGNENSSLFSTAMGFLGNMNKDDDDVDEEKVQRQHQEAYNQGNAGSMSANGIGAAAAMQALKMFTSGQSNASGSGGGDMQSKIIGMAMSEAAKLFDQSGGATQGNKQDAVTSAGQTIMKLLIKSQVSGMTGGGNSGGLSSLLGMASKFM